jgi:hypothetical protein
VSQRFVFRLGAFIVLGLIISLMRWAFLSTPDDPRLVKAQQLISNGQIYNMSQQELAASFGEPSPFHLHAAWDEDFELGSAGLTQDKWLVVRLNDDDQVSEAKILEH